MHRLPSTNALESMGKYNRDATLEAFARDIGEQIDGLNTGHHKLEGRLDLKTELNKLQQRLLRVKRAAARFNLDLAA